MNIRTALQQALNAVMVLSTAFMLWKSLAVYGNCETPIVVVLSESMEPAFQRGDVLFLSNPARPIAVGDITVFNTHGRTVAATRSGVVTGTGIPIVHRVLRVHHDTATGAMLLRTKGDNNDVDDRAIPGAYGPVHRREQWISEQDVIGRVAGHVPYLGWATLAFNAFPWLKYALIAILGASSMFT